MLACLHCVRTDSHVVKGPGFGRPRKFHNMSAEGGWLGLKPRPPLFCVKSAGPLRPAIPCPPVSTLASLSKLKHLVVVLGSNAPRWWYMHEFFTSSWQWGRYMENCSACSLIGCVHVWGKGWLVKVSSFWCGILKKKPPLQNQRYIRCKGEGFFTFRISTTPAKLESQKYFLSFLKQVASGFVSARRSKSAKGLRNKKNSEFTCLFILPSSHPKSSLWFLLCSAWKGFSKNGAWLCLFSLWLCLRPFVMKCVHVGFFPGVTQCDQKFHKVISSVFVGWPV